MRRSSGFSGTAGQEWRDQEKRMTGTGVREKKNQEKMNSERERLGKRSQKRGGKWGIPAFPIWLLGVAS
jgi:hypothetical protein